MLFASAQLDHKSFPNTPYKWATQPERLTLSAMFSDAITSELVNPSQWGRNPSQWGRHPITVGAKPITVGAKPVAVHKDCSLVNRKPQSK